MTGSSSTTRILGPVAGESNDSAMVHLRGLRGHAVAARHVPSHDRWMTLRTDGEHRTLRAAGIVRFHLGPPEAARTIGGLRPGVKGSEGRGSAKATRAGSTPYGAKVPRRSPPSLDRRRRRCKPSKPRRDAVL